MHATEALASGEPLAAVAEQRPDTSSSPPAPDAPGKDLPAGCAIFKRTKSRKVTSTERKLETVTTSQTGKAISYRGVRQRPWVSSFV